MNVKAFPSGQNDPTRGMDLRDWFAGQVLSKFVEINDRVTAGRDVSYEDALKVTAQQAYRVADAMLAARTKES